MTAYNAVEGSANVAAYRQHILVESLMPRWIATGGISWSGTALGTTNGVGAITGSGGWNSLYESDSVADGLKGFVNAGTQWFTANWNTTTKTVTWAFGTSDTGSQAAGSGTTNYTSTIPVGDGTFNGYTTKTYSDDLLETFRRDFLMDAKMLGYEHYASGRGSNLMFVEHPNRYKGLYGSASTDEMKKLIPWISNTSNRVFGELNPNTYY